MGLFSSKKYEVSDIKKWYDNAEKNFNPIKFGNTNKEPSSKVFMSKIYFKFLSLNYKSIQKMFNGINKEYFLKLEKTNGDYSRRPGKYFEVYSETVTKINNLIKDYPELQYTVIGVFKDIFEVLKDPKWIQAFKLSFDYCKKTGDRKSIASGYKTLYYSMVTSLEVLSGSIAVYLQSLSFEEFKPVELAIKLHYKLGTLMDKIVYSSVNLSTLMRLTKDPISYVKNLIKGEETAKKSKESLELLIKNDEEFKSQEGLLQKAFVENRYLWTIVSTGITAFAFASSMPGAGLFGVALSTYLTVAFAVVLVMCIIPCTRHIIYFVNIAGIDMQKEAELNVELLSNNIKALEEKLSNSDNQAEREKISKVIEKQKEIATKMKEKLFKQTGNLEYAIDNELDKDDVSSNNEADSQGTETGVDGDSVDNSSSDDGGEFELSI